MKKKKVELEIKYKPENELSRKESLLLQTATIAMAPIPDEFTVYTACLRMWNTFHLGQEYQKELDKENKYDTKRTNTGP